MSSNASWIPIWHPNRLCSNHWLPNLAQATGDRKSQDAAQASEQALDQLAEQIKNMDEAQRQELAQNLAQAAAQAGQSGDAQLSQALASLAQAVQSGDAQSVQKASQDARGCLGRNENPAGGPGCIATCPGAGKRLQTSFSSNRAAGRSIQREFKSVQSRKQSWQRTDRRAEGQWRRDEG